MLKELLYKKTPNGKIQQWQVEIDGNRYRTLEGELNGKITTTAWTICTSKRGTTPEQQAEKEVTSKYKKKQDSGYVTTLSAIPTETQFSPMLAHTLDDPQTITYPLGSQPKLDGIRCYINKNGMFTRNHKVINSCPHIFNLVKPIFTSNPDCVLDGELYNHTLKADFNEITSIVKRINPTQDDINKAAVLMQFHMYDGYRTTQLRAEGYLLRNQDLVKNLSSIVGKNNSIVFVETTLLTQPEMVHTQLEKYLEQGYEGQIIRLLNYPYEFKRSYSLLKHKIFQDAEFEIIGVSEGIGNRTGTVGYFTLRTGENEEFRSNVKGSFEYIKNLFNDRANLIGKKATVVFFNYTPRGVPRFPFVKAIRDYD